MVCECESANRVTRFVWAHTTLTRLLLCPTAPESHSQAAPATRLLFLLWVQHITNQVLPQYPAESGCPSRAGPRLRAPRLLLLDLHRRLLRLRPYQVAQRVQLCGRLGDAEAAWFGVGVGVGAGLGVGVGVTLA